MKPFFPNRIFLCLVASLFGVFSAAAENPDALKQQILAQARSVGPDDFAFTRTIRTEEMEGSKTEQHALVESWDPTKSAEQRWTLVSIDGHEPASDDLAKYRKSLASRRVPNYGRVAEYFGERATSEIDAKGRTVYSFATLPKGTVVIGDVDMSASAKGEVVVGGENDSRFVEQVRFTSTKSTRVKLIAVIERLEATTHYRLMPNGKPVPSEQVTDVTGSMLGKHGRIRTSVAYTQQRAIR